MKHQLITPSNSALEEGDIADLKRCLWLVRMNAATRGSTVKSLADFQAACGASGVLSVSAIQQMVEAPGTDLRVALGPKATQVLSDARRALKHWNDPPVRWLALRMRHQVPTLSDADVIARLQLEADEASRTTGALVSFARANGGTLEDFAATMAAIEPLLRAASPETFGVKSMKSLENKKTLVRNAVRLVDPLTSGARETSVRTLPKYWQAELALVKVRLKEHETSAMAILRRFACFCAQRNIMPLEVDGPTAEAFVSIELATHAPGYVEKLRAAFRRWNESVEAGNKLPFLALPGATQHRQTDVAWTSVPAGIREPVDAFLATAISARCPEDWDALVPNDDSEYAELGVSFLDASSVQQTGAPILDPGTCKNWRDAIKRTWHAAFTDPRVQPKPEVIGDLFAQPVIAALVASTRKSRRDRMEASGRVFDSKVKGRYEHTLVEALCSVGRALSVAPERQEALEELKRQLDPSVIGLKRASDGSFKRVYADRRIGPRHAGMLAAFADTTRLKRWFEGPSVLWSRACEPIRKGGKPRIDHVALARSALIARIGQYIAPIRRTNNARLRHQGDDRHLILPEGDGDGTLIIPAVEGKTLREIHVRIDRETVRMLKYYIRHFLPVALKLAKASPDNPHLFPGADGTQQEDGGYAPGRGFITKSKLNTSFKKHMKKYCGLDLCLHVMRHLAGKIILDQDPSAMALVQEVLGHKRIKTTQSYYAEVSKLVAQRRYIHLLERQSRQVLAKVTFKFVDPRTGKEI